MKHDWNLQSFSGNNKPTSFSLHGVSASRSWLPLRSGDCFRTRRFLFGLIVAERSPDTPTIRAGRIKRCRNPEPAARGTFLCRWNLCRAPEWNSEKAWIQRCWCSRRAHRDPLRKVTLLWRKQEKTLQGDTQPQPKWKNEVKLKWK